MSYTNDLIRYARLFETPLSIERDEQADKYKVFIHLVSFKNKGAYKRQQIRGTGFTIEDACDHFLRLARGGILHHSLTDQEVEVL